MYRFPLIFYDFHSTTKRCFEVAYNIGICYNKGAHSNDFKTKGDFTMKKTVRTAISLILVAVMLSLTLAGCAKKNPDAVTVGMLESQSIEQASIRFAVKNFKLEDGTKHPDNIIKKTFPTLNTMLLELNSGKIDFISGLPKCTTDYIKNSHDDLTTTDGNVVTNFHMGTKVADADLQAEIDSALAELKSNGELDKLIKEYITDLSGEPVPNEIIGNPDGETHIVGITGDMPPMDYVAADGTPAGFNVALLNAIAQINGCNFEVVQVDAGARTTALVSDLIDIIFWLGCVDTEGFDTSNDEVLLTESYYSCKNEILTKDFPVEKIKEVSMIK